MRVSFVGRSARVAKVDSEVAICQLAESFRNQGRDAARRPSQLIIQFEILAQTRSLKQCRNCIGCYESLLIYQKILEIFCNYVWTPGTKHAD